MGAQRPTKVPTRAHARAGANASGRRRSRERSERRSWRTLGESDTPAGTADKGRHALPYPMIIKPNLLFLRIGGVTPPLKSLRALNSKAVRAFRLVNWNPCYYTGNAKLNCFQWKINQPYRAKSGTTFSSTTCAENTQ